MASVSRPGGTISSPLHCAGVWDAAPLEAELLAQADRLVGGDNAVLVIDDTALPKKGNHSVGVAPQYASALGKNGELPDAGLRDAGARRSAGDGRAASFYCRRAGRVILPG